MDERHDWNLLVSALCKQIDGWPLGKWFTMEELASCSPEIAFDEDEEKYAVEGSGMLYSPEDVDEAENEVQGYAEEKGFFVEWDSDKGISLRERVDVDREFDFDEIESFVLTYEPALLFGGRSVARYDGEMLEIVPELPDVAGFSGRSVQMSSEKKVRRWCMPAAKPSDLT